MQKILILNLFVLSKLDNIFDKGNIIDRFRSRIIFPIKNFSGRVVGFGGRIISEQKKVPKYINSIESEIYNKSKILYGLFESKSDIVKSYESHTSEIITSSPGLITETKLPKL